MHYNPVNTKQTPTHPKKTSSGQNSIVRSVSILKYRNEVDGVIPFTVN